jgi:hypothetical protein
VGSVTDFFPEFVSKAFSCRIMPKIWLLLAVLSAIDVNSIGQENSAFGPTRRFDTVYRTVRNWLLSATS